MSKEIKEIKARIRQCTKEYKQARKIVKQQCKTDLKALKIRYKQDHSVLKAELNEIKPPFRLSSAADNVTLTLCKPFEEWANDLRYKKADPEGYEADQTVEEVADIVKSCQKKLAKGKSLRARSISLLMELQTVMLTIAESKLGNRFEEASQLVDQIEALQLSCPTMETAKKFMDQFEDTIKKVFETQTA